MALGGGTLGSHEKNTATKNTCLKVGQMVGGPLGMMDP